MYLHLLHGGRFSDSRHLVSTAGFSSNSRVDFRFGFWIDFPQESNSEHQNPKHLKSINGEQWPVNRRSKNITASIARPCSRSIADVHVPRIDDKDSAKSAKQDFLSISGARPRSVLVACGACDEPGYRLVCSLFVTARYASHSASGADCLLQQSSRMTPLPPTSDASHWASKSLNIVRDIPDRHPIPAAVGAPKRPSS